MADIHDQIMALIPKGKENAIPQAVLAGLIGVNDRQVRRIINHMRRLLFPVFTDLHGGYYQPGANGVDEAKEFYRQMTRRGRSSMASAKCAKEFILEHDNQISFDNL